MATDKFGSAVGPPNHSSKYARPCQALASPCQAITNSCQIIGLVLARVGEGLPRAGGGFARPGQGWRRFDEAIITETAVGGRSRNHRAVSPRGITWSQTVWHGCPTRPSGSRAPGSNRAYAAVCFAEQHVQIAKGLGGLPARPPAMPREATQR